jgi:uncharacterized protein YbbK (DUF523 family)
VQFELFTFCPEMTVGLGVPRPPIQLVESHGRRRVQGVDFPHKDVTDALHALVDQLPDDICGFVLKARSPSCGLGTTPVFHKGVQVATGDGAFADSLKTRFPALPLIDEEEVEDTDLRNAFVAAVHAFRQAHVRHT